MKKTIMILCAVYAVSLSAMDNDRSRQKRHGKPRRREERLSAPSVVTRDLERAVPAVSENSKQKIECCCCEFEIERYELTPERSKTLKVCAYGLVGGYGVLSAGLLATVIWASTR